MMVMLRMVRLGVKASVDANARIGIDLALLAYCIRTTVTLVLQLANTVGLLVNIVILLFRVARV